MRSPVCWALNQWLITLLQSVAGPVSAEIRKSVVGFTLVRRIQNSSAGLSELQGGSLLRKIEPNPPTFQQKSSCWWFPLDMLCPWIGRFLLCEAQQWELKQVKKPSGENKERSLQPFPFFYSRSPCWWTWKWPIIERRQRKNESFVVASWTRSSCVVSQRSGMIQYPVINQSIKLYSHRHFSLSCFIKWLKHQTDQEQE